ncbi:MAG: TetR family transcriptional regulator [Actinomycetota bacterium]|nr:TetR family transcriptional regulator [Actinomycetota bacterium]
MTDDTKSRILDAAEQLFAEHGFDGTSVREITRAADANVAAVHYHFGSKEAVLRGVTDRVAGPINARRRELLDATVTAAGPGVPSIELLLDAFVRADVEILLQLQERGPVVARFLGRTYADQTPWIQRMAQEQYAEASGFFPAMAVALPHLTPEEIEWRINKVVAVIVHLFATWPEDGMCEADAEVLLRRLVTFLSGGLRAPSPTLAPTPDSRR